MKVEIKDNATINYVEELSKHFDIIVEDGKVFITSIYGRKDKEKNVKKNNKRADKKTHM